jgi:GAF domain
LATPDTGLDEHRSRSRQILRTAVVVGLVASVLVVSLPGLLPSMRDNGTVLNLGFDAAGRVQSVDAVSGRAGLRVGDRLMLDGLTLKRWEQLTVGAPMAIGEAIPLTVERNERTVRLEIKADAVTGWPTYWVYAIKTLSQVIYLIVACTLVLRKPSRLTWSFFALAIGYAADITQPWFWRSSATSLPMLWWAALDNGFVITPGALFIFAASFPGRTSGPFWRVVDRTGMPLNLILTLQNVVFFIGGVMGSSLAFPALTVPSWSFATLAGVCLVVVAYWSSVADQRQRLKWVIFAFIVSYLERALVSYAEYTPGLWPPAWSSAGFSPDVLSIVNVLVPVTVAYAVLKHRVLDINFVISRALVYGIITSLVVGAFALIDFVLSKELEQHQLAVAVEVVFAIAFGFGLNGIHKQVDAFVDRILFRSRHLAERTIERVAAGLPHVTSARAVDETLAADPARALNLLSAAVFVRDETGAFACRSAIGWTDGGSAKIDADDPLIVNLLGEFGTMSLREVRQGSATLPTGVRAPAIAVPMFVRHQLLGFVLYGAHASGEDIDPDERRLLERLAHAAAATYDHIDSESVRTKLREMSQELAVLKASAHA